MPIPLRDLFTPPRAHTTTILPRPSRFRTLSQTFASWQRLKVTRHRRIRFFRLGEPEKRRRERISFDERGCSFKFFVSSGPLTLYFLLLLKSVERGDDKTGPGMMNDTTWPPSVFQSSLSFSLSLSLSLSLFAC